MSKSALAAAAPRFRRKLADERRQALIDAAIESLKRHGHEGLSVRAICAQAGVSIGLINHHFPQKEQLIAESYRELNRRLHAALMVAVERAQPDARARLRACFLATFSRPNLDPEVLSAWVVFWGLQRHSPEVHAVHNEAYSQYTRFLRELLRDLEAEQGAFRFSLRLAAIGLTAILDGLWLEYCLDPGTFKPTEAVILCESWVDGLRRH